MKFRIIVCCTIFGLSFNTLASNPSHCSIASPNSGYSNFLSTDENIRSMDIQLHSGDEIKVVQDELGLIETTLVDSVGRLKLSMQIDSDQGKIRTMFPDLSHAVEFKVGLRRTSTYWSAMQLLHTDYERTHSTELIDSAIEASTALRMRSIGEDGISVDEIGGKWHGEFMSLAPEALSRMNPADQWDLIESNIKTISVGFNDSDEQIVIDQELVPIDYGFNPIHVRSTGGNVSNDNSSISRAGDHLVKVYEGKEHVGSVRWFSENRTLAWLYPGVVGGMVDDERIPGGINKPTLEDSLNQAKYFWNNRELYVKMQTESKYKFRKTTPNTTKSTRSIGSSLGDVVVGFSMPPGYDDGCSNIVSSFNGTNFEACCREHDQCYYYGHGYDESATEQDQPDAPECDISSWTGDEGWGCMSCNLEAIGCWLSTLADYLGFGCIPSSQSTGPGSCFGMFQCWESITQQCPWD